MTNLGWLIGLIVMLGDPTTLTQDVGLTETTSLEHFQCLFNWFHSSLYCCLCLAPFDRAFMPPAVRPFTHYLINFTVFACVVSNIEEMCLSAQMSVRCFTSSLQQLTPRLIFCCCHDAVLQFKAWPARMIQRCKGEKAPRRRVLWPAFQQCFVNTEQLKGSMQINLKQIICFGKSSFIWNWNAKIHKCQMST